MTQEEKRKEYEYWTKLLADGPVWCKVWTHQDADSIQVVHRLVYAYLGGYNPFASVACAGKEDAARSEYSAGRYSTSTWSHATPILPKTRRPWTAEEIMLHQGCFEVDGFLTRVLCAHNGKVQFAKGPFAIVDILWETVGRFVERSMAVMPDGTRVELYKDGE